VEALDLPVRLRPVGSCLLDLDAQFGAGVAPEAGFVGGAVVGEDPVNGDAAVREPGHGPQQDPDGGRCGLVVVDLGVGDAGVIVDDGVEVRGAISGCQDLFFAATGVAAQLRLPSCRPTYLQPPPSGMLPSFFTSTWMRSPGFSCS
jgi:hypothetical protein